MPKFITIEEAVKLIPNGATVMFGGFMGCGTAHKFLDALSKSDVKDLTMIANDAAMPGGPMGEDHYGCAKLIHNHQVEKSIAQGTSHQEFHAEIIYALSPGLIGLFPQLAVALDHHVAQDQGAGFVKLLVRGVFGAYAEIVRQLIHDHGFDLRRRNLKIHSNTSKTCAYNRGI